MHKIELLLGFIILMTAALVVIAISLDRRKKNTWILMLGFVILTAIGYLNWGGWFLWETAFHRQEQLKQAQDILAQFKTPEELIERLKQQLKIQPQRAKGWFLLGRLYAGQGQWDLARQAFLKAQQLKPNDEQVTINYIEAVWQLNQQSFTPDIKSQLLAILKKNPKQPDALSLLALDAYKTKHYQRAILYWQRLLKLTPLGSKEAIAIRKAIAQAEANEP